MPELASPLAPDAASRVISGGHDWTWWILEMIEEIGALLNPR
ncbi:MAG: hypothetical protein QM607_05690 [Microbacterium sp.]